MLAQMFCSALLISYLCVFDTLTAKSIITNCYSDKYHRYIVILIINKSIYHFSHFFTLRHEVINPFLLFIYYSLKFFYLLLFR